MLYYKGMKNKIEEKRVDKDMIEKRWQFLEFEAEELEPNVIRERYQESEEKWKAFKEKAAEERDKEMLDEYPEEISGDSEVSRKRRKKAIKIITKA